MKLSGNVKPISQLKADARNVLRSVAENREPIVITVRGAAAAVLQDVQSYQDTQDTLALLKILALSNKALADDKIEPVEDAFTDLRKQLDI